MAVTSLSHAGTERYEYSIEMRAEIRSSYAGRRAPTTNRNMSSCGPCLMRIWQEAGADAKLELAFTIADGIE